MAGILRGDVIWADLNPVRGSEQAGIRPVIVLSGDRFNDSSRTVVVMAITSREPRVPFPLALELRSLPMPKRSWALTTQVRTVAKERLDETIGRASRHEVDRLVAGLNRILR